MKRVLDRVVLTDFNLRNVFTANSCLGEVVSGKFAARPRVCAVLYETKQAVNLSAHKDGGSPETIIPKTEAIIAVISVPCHNEQMPRSSFCSTTST
jgi:hypothetical protein